MSSYTAADMPAAKTAKSKLSKTKSVKKPALKKSLVKTASAKTTSAKKLPAKKSSASPKAKPDFPAVFSALRKMLESFSGEIATQIDKPGNYHTVVPGLVHRKKPLYFAGIKTGKNYVSYHLLPVYYSPELLKGMSPALKKRMQGMACFNFTSVDDECFAELKQLAAAGLKKFKTEGFRQQLASLQ
ncbi:MAG TPA: hypothetical protein VGK22_17390 [Candidatus Angelobacter sp.]|jgi:hypothetical protein